MKNGAALCMAIIMFALPLGVAMSQERELIAGLSMEEVKNRWGEPLDRVEKESRRVEVWSYPAGEIIFLEGKLTKFPLSQTNAHSGATLADSPGSARSAPIPPGSSGDLAANDVQGEDQTNVFADVLRAIPDDTSEKAGPSLLHRPTAPNRPNPRAMVQPIPGGAAVADLEESEELEQP